MGSCQTPIDEICIVSFNILIIYYLFIVNLHEILTFVYMQSTYSLAVKYINCKHDSSLVMNMTISNWRKKWYDSSYKKICDEFVSLQMIKFVQSFDIQPNLHEVLKFVHLHSTNSLAVNYVNSKHDSRLVMNITFSN
jgi:hypothetical protein